MYDKIEADKIKRGDKIKKDFEEKMSKIMKEVEQVKLECKMAKKEGGKYLDENVYRSLQEKIKKLYNKLDEYNVMNSNDCLITRKIIMSNNKKNH